MAGMGEINAGISELGISQHQGIGFPNVGNSGISLPQSRNFPNRLRQISEIPALGVKTTYIRFKRPQSALDGTNLL